MGNGYDVAQFCLNGHLINDSSVKYPQHNSDYCGKCGEPTTTSCSSCNESIRGYYSVEAIAVGPRYDRPAYCPKCGSAYPWTERALQAAVELAVEVGGLTGDDAKQFEQSVKDITHDTSRTTIGASRLKRLLSKVSNEVAGGVRDIIVDVASETAKKLLFP